MQITRGMFGLFHAGSVIELSEWIVCLSAQRNLIISSITKPVIYW